MAKIRKPLDISPERVKGKLGECDFFLERMTKTQNAEKFGYHFSAFLGAFKTFVDLALRYKHGRNWVRELRQLRGNSLIHRLLDLRDIEVHRDGIRIWHHGSSPSENMIPRRMFGNQILATPQGPTRRFIEEFGLDLLESCNAGLAAVRSLAS